MKYFLTALFLSFLCACPCKKPLPQPAPPCDCPNPPGQPEQRPDQQSFDVALEHFDTMIAVTHGDVLGFLLEGSPEDYEYKIFPMPELVQDQADDTVLRLTYPDQERKDAFGKLEVSGEPPRYLVKACVDEYVSTCKAYVTIQGKKPIRLHVDMNDQSFEWEPEHEP